MPKFPCEKSQAGKFFKFAHVRLYYIKHFDPTAKSACGKQKIIRRVTHCIFDLDGTILNSEAMYHEVLAQVCKKYGKVYSKDIQQRMLGGTDRHISEQVVKELQIDVSVDKFECELLSLSEKVLSTAPLQTGVERLLKHLDENQVPVALATNSTVEQVQLHAKTKPEIFKIFHHVVTATDPGIRRGKPHPDLFLAAAERFCDQPHPKQCLVFEDSPVGLQAGVAAGMQVVLTPHYKLEPEYIEQATMVLPDFLAFRPELFGLPPFRDGCCNQQMQKCPGPQKFTPPPSACDPCKPQRCNPCPPIEPKPCDPKPCAPKKCDTCQYGLTENSALLVTMLLSLIFGILYRLW